MAGDTRLKWNPPSRDRASVDRALGAAAPGARAHDRLRSRAAGEGTRRGHLDTAPGCGQRGRDDAARRRHRGARPPRRRARAVVDLLLDDAGAALRALPAQGHDRGRRRRRLRSRRDRRHARTRRRRSSSTTSSRKWSPFDGREVKVYPVYTVVRGRVVFAEGRGYRRTPGTAVPDIAALAERRLSRAADAQGGRAAADLHRRRARAAAARRGHSAQPPRRGRARLRRRTRVRAGRAAATRRREPPRTGSSAATSSLPGVAELLDAGSGRGGLRRRHPPRPPGTARQTE